jgi:ectoine hydroxylase-related dioxygenase (phytanoyl-CoA dioxygenase family)
MFKFEEIGRRVSEHGFAVVDGVYSPTEIDAIRDVLGGKDHSGTNFRKSAELFAIRQFLKEVPEVIPALFTARFCELIKELFGREYFVAKSIYFDKPGGSNWFVAYHQDLTISVDRKADVSGYGPWTVKPGYFSVQPPVHILRNNFTVRIHLDDTDKDNGALRVLPGTHLNGVVKAGTIAPDISDEVVCDVSAGGVMIMKPLLMHASGRTTDSRSRRVIHIEFGADELLGGLKWAERMGVPE